MSDFPFTKDELLHVPLGLLAAALFWKIADADGGAWIWLGAGWFLYLREVIQNQSRNQLPFYRGWVLDWWHAREWLVPTVLIALGWAAWRAWVWLA